MKPRTIKKWCYKCGEITDFAILYNFNKTKQHLHCLKCGRHNSRYFQLNKQEVINNE